MAQTKTRPLGLGLIGCGGFGEYCLETYANTPGIRPAAAGDTVRAAADRLAGRFGIPAVYDAEAVMARDDVDIVHIATPPSTHHELATKALAAGKHVLVEKPLAVNLADADDILADAAARERIAPVNFVLRYSPVADAVDRIIHCGALGRVLHGVFENFAQDEGLGPRHWFWNPKVSGGIFVEHAVHFFDLYAGWLGTGKVTAAHAEMREDSTAQDRVMCMTRYDSGAVVYQYHGFDQAARMDRQNHHLLFELGDLYVYGWVPQSLVLTALVDEERLALLSGIIPSAQVEVLDSYARPQDRIFRSRWQERRATQKVRLSWDAGLTKDELYRKCIADLMSDQLAYLADRSRGRRVAEANGRDALAMAVQATELAKNT
jgi:predicted dehydrogenase